MKTGTGAPIEDDLIKVPKYSLRFKYYRLQARATCRQQINHAVGPVKGLAADAGEGDPTYLLAHDHKFALSV